MRRLDFITDVKSDKTTKYEPINNGNIQIFINGKKSGYVQSMKIHADLSYGFLRASVTTIRRSNSVGDPILHTDTINENMEAALILEKIVDDGKFTNFYLRTILDIP